MSQLGNKIRARREELGLSQQEVADAIGVKQPTIVKLESGKQRTIKNIAALAKFLEMSLSELDPSFIDVSVHVDSTAELLSGSTIKAVKVVGVVQAGVWTEFENFEDDGFDGEEIPCIPGRYANLRQTAFKVKGNSMDADRIFDGDYVVAVPYFDARADIKEGDRVIVERQRNSAVERTVKIVEIHGKNIHFCPKSTDPRFKPIIVKISRQMKESDDTEVRLLGLVIWRGSYV